MARVTPPRRAYDAAKVFTSALQFNATCDYLMRTDPATQNALTAAIGYPLLALSALTLELLFKTLHALQTELPVPKTHDLGSLYRGLERRARLRIDQEWTAIYQVRAPMWDKVKKLNLSGKPMRQMSSSAEIALSEGALAFERFRYTFELSDDNSPDYYVDDLRPALIRMVHEARPDLRVWTPSAQHLDLEGPPQSDHQ